MIADVKPTRGPREVTPSDGSEPGPGDGPVVEPPAAPPAIESNDEPLAPMATRWPHTEAALARKRALSRRRR